MCIYFIQAEQGGLIKIGYSNNPSDRLYSLQLMCPVPLKLLSVIKDIPKVREDRVHFDLSKSRQYGEWFKPSIEVLTYMEQNAVEFEPPITRFDEEDFVMVGKHKHKRCKGYSRSMGKRCSNSSIWDTDFCSHHKP